MEKSMEELMSTSYRVFECKGCKSVYVTRKDYQKHISICIIYKSKYSKAHKKIDISGPRLVTPKQEPTEVVELSDDTEDGRQDEAGTVTSRQTSSPSPKAAKLETAAKKGRFKFKPVDKVVEKLKRQSVARPSASVARGRKVSQNSDRSEKHSGDDVVTELQTKVRSDRKRKTPPTPGDGEESAAYQRVKRWRSKLANMSNEDVPTASPSRRKSANNTQRPAASPHSKRKQSKGHSSVTPQKKVVCVKLTDISQSEDVSATAAYTGNAASTSGSKRSNSRSDKASRELRRLNIDMNASSVDGDSDIVVPETPDVADKAKPRSGHPDTHQGPVTSTQRSPGHHRLTKHRSRGNVSEMDGLPSHIDEVNDDEDSNESTVKADSAVTTPVEREKLLTVLKSGDYLCRFLSSRDFSDAVIRTNICEIPVHRIVLASRYPQLSQCLLSESVIDMSDLTYGHVSLWLKYLYTNDESALSDIPTDVLQALYRFIQQSPAAGHLSHLNSSAISAAHNVSVLHSKVKSTITPPAAMTQSQGQLKVTEKKLRSNKFVMTSTPLEQSRTKKKKPVRLRFTKVRKSSRATHNNTSNKVNNSSISYVKPNTSLSQRSAADIVKRQRDRLRILESPHTPGMQANPRRGRGRPPKTPGGVAANNSISLSRKSQLSTELNLTKSIIKEKRRAGRPRQKSNGADGENILQRGNTSSAHNQDTDDKSSNAPVVTEKRRPGRPKKKVEESKAAMPSDQPESEYTQITDDNNSDASTEGPSKRKQSYQRKSTSAFTHPQPDYNIHKFTDNSLTGRSYGSTAGRRQSRARGRGRGRGRGRPSRAAAEQLDDDSASRETTASIPSEGSIPQLPTPPTFELKSTRTDTHSNSLFYQTSEDAEAIAQNDGQIHSGAAYDVAQPVFGVNAAPLSSDSNSSQLQQLIDLVDHIRPAVIPNLAVKLSGSPLIYRDRNQISDAGRMVAETQNKSPSGSGDSLHGDDLAISQVLSLQELTEVSELSEPINGKSGLASESEPHSAIEVAQTLDDTSVNEQPPTARPPIEDDTFELTAYDINATHKASQQSPVHRQTYSEGDKARSEVDTSGDELALGTIDECEEDSQRSNKGHTDIRETKSGCETLISDEEMISLITPDPPVDLQTDDEILTAEPDPASLGNAEPGMSSTSEPVDTADNLSWSTLSNGSPGPETVASTNSKHEQEEVNSPVPDVDLRSDPVADADPADKDERIDLTNSDSDGPTDRGGDDLPDLDADGGVVSLLDSPPFQQPDYHSEPGGHVEDEELWGDFDDDWEAGTQRPPARFAASRSKSTVQQTPSCYSQHPVSPVRPAGTHRAYVPSPFTPMLNYEAMNDDQLKRRLKGFGLRDKMSRKRMIAALTQIYKETHVYETDTSAEWTVLPTPSKPGLSTPRKHALSTQPSRPSNLSKASQSVSVTASTLSKPSTSTTQGTTKAAKSSKEPSKTKKTAPVAMSASSKLSQMADLAEKVKRSGNTEQSSRDGYQTNEALSGENPTSSQSSLKIARVTPMSHITKKQSTSKSGDCEIDRLLDEVDELLHDISSDDETADDREDRAGETNLNSANTDSPMDEDSGSSESEDDSNAASSADLVRPDDLEAALKQLIESNKELYTRILNYQMIPRLELLTLIKTAKIKCSTKELDAFCYKQCIPVQNKNDRTRKGQKGQKKKATNSAAKTSTSQAESSQP